MFINLKREDEVRGEKERESKREREIGRLLLHNLGMCPELELNLQPFVVWDDAPTN